MMQKSKSSKEEIRSEMDFADKVMGYPELANKCYLKAIALMMYEKRYGKFVSIKEEE